MFKISILVTFAVSSLCLKMFQKCDVSNLSRGYCCCHDLELDAGAVSQSGHCGAIDIGGSSSRCEEQLLVLCCDTFAFKACYETCQSAREQIKGLDTHCSRRSLIRAIRTLPSICLFSDIIPYLLITFRSFCCSALEWGVHDLIRCPSIHIARKTMALFARHSILCFQSLQKELT